jgi:spore coat protein U-like protein
MSKFNVKAVTGILLVAGLVSVSGMASAATATSTVNVGATLEDACTVSSAATIAFGTISNLSGGADLNADSGGTFTVTCSSGAAPTIGASPLRVMSDGEHDLPFNLSLSAGAATDNFPTLAAPGALGVVMDGTTKTVPIYARVPAANLGTLTSGAYAVALTINVNY